MLYDKDIREPLFEYLEDVFGNIRILEELTLGSSRADILMVTEEALTGVEIKSDADSYARLSGQVKDYDRYCDRCIIAVGSSHAEHVVDHVPPYWGIITVETADGEPDFYMLREPSANPSGVLDRQTGLLWRIEMKHIQEKNMLPKYKEKSKRFVAGKLLEKVPHDILKKQVLAELFDRDYTAVGAETEEFRRSEIDKKLDGVADLQQKALLLIEKNMKKRQLKTRKKRRRRRLL
ncbi:MAG: MmcB family DNA repair protein [Lachnospiraceae bacterium]|nr:MmcB family DNA repair protein [Lachnospiraceae bacterium]